MLINEYSYYSDIYHEREMLRSILISIILMYEAVPRSWETFGKTNNLLESLEMCALDYDKYMSYIIEQLHPVFSARDT